MFKGLRQKIGQGLSAQSKGSSSPHAALESTHAKPPETVHSPPSQSVKSSDSFFDETPTVTPSGSLLNLNEDRSDTSLMLEQSDSLIDLHNDYSGPAVLDISGSGSNILDIKSPHDHGTRSRTSSVSSQASDSFFSPMSVLSSRQIPLPSDVESIASEMEDGGSVPDSVSKDDLYRSYCRMQQRSSRYRYKFTQVVKAYQEIEKERDKLRETMTKSQDKAFRRISELKEQIQLDQLAKVDLEQNYLLMLEEKDELIKVLKMQISLLKQGKEVPSELTQQAEKSKKKKLDGVDSTPDSLNEGALKEKISRMSSLLLASKESISKNREHIQKLTAENAQVQEDLEKVKLEREQLQSTSLQKDQALEALVEKLKAENLRLFKELPQKIDDHNQLHQIEHLHLNLLSQVVSAQHLSRESEEQLFKANAENCRLISENELLMEEIAEQKCALEKYMHGDIASKFQVNSACLCSRHKLGTLTEEGSCGEMVNYLLQTGPNETSGEFMTATRVSEHGAGEFVMQASSTCIVCKKEQLLFTANEKIQRCQERILLLEETVTQMQLELDQRKTDLHVIHANKIYDLYSTGDVLSEDQRLGATTMPKETSVVEVERLNDKTEWLENQRNELLNDGESHDQTLLDNLGQGCSTKTDQITQKLSLELEQLMSHILHHETGSLKQGELSKLTGRFLENLNLEFNAQHQSYEMKISVVSDENQKLVKQLKAAEERHLTISNALEEVLSLKASLATSVHAIVQESVQEAMGLVEHQTKPSQKTLTLDKVTADQQEDLKNPAEQLSADETFIESKNKEVNELVSVNSDEATGISEVEELQNKNDSLHRLLHEWQCCVQVLKTCLDEKQKEIEVFVNNLEEKQRENEIVNDQLHEALHSVEVLKQERELFKDESEKLRSDLSSSEIGAEKLQNDLREIKIESEKLQSDFKLLEIEMTKLQGDLKSAEIETEKLQGDLKSSEFEAVRLQNDLSSAETECERLKNDLKSSEAECEKLKNDHKTAETEYEKLQNDLKSSELETERLRDDLKAAETECEKLQNDLKSVEAECKQLQNDLKSSELEIVRLQNDLKSAETECEKLQNYINSAEPKCEKLQKDLTSAESECEKLTKDLKLAKTDCEKLQNDLTAAETECEKLKNDFKSSETECERLKNALKSAETECETLQNDLNSSELETVKLQNALKAAELECEKLQDNLRCSEQESDKLKIDLKASEYETERLHTDLRSQDEECRNISQQLCAANGQIEDLLLTMHDLKKLKDSEEMTLKKSLCDAVDSAERGLNSKIHQVRKEKDELEFQFQQLQQQSEDSVENLRSRNESLIQQFKQMKAKEVNLLERVAEMDRVNNELRRQQELHENNMNYLQNQFDALRQKNDEVQQKEKSVNEELARTSERYRVGQDAMERSKGDETALQCRLEALLDEKTLLEKRCQEQIDQINELEVHKDQGSSSKNKMQKAVKLLKDRNDSLSQQVKESAELVENCLKEKLELENQNESLLLQLKELADSKDVLQKEAQDQRDHNLSVMHRIEEFEAERNSLHRCMQDLRSENESLSDQIRLLEEQRVSMQKELQDLELQYEAVSCDIKTLQEEKSAFQEKERSMESHSESLGVQVNILEDKHACIIKELNELELKNKLLECSLQDMEATKQSSLHELAENENQLLEELNAGKMQLLEFATLNKSLESQLAESGAARSAFEEKLEFSEAEISRLREITQNSEEECRQLSETVKALTEQNGQKDLDIVAFKEKLLQLDRSHSKELFTLRKHLYAITYHENEMPSVIEQCESLAEEFTALDSFVKSELSSCLSEMKAQTSGNKIRISDDEKKILELEKRIEIAEMNLNEEELQWKKKHGNAEIENEELRSQVANLQISAKETQDRFDDFKAKYEKHLSEKDALLVEIENKLGSLCGESFQETMLLSEIVQQVEEKLFNLSERCVNYKKIVDEFEAENESTKIKILELTETLGKTEEHLKKAEANTESLECERDRLTTKIQELTDEISALQEKNISADDIIAKNRETLENLQDKVRTDAEEHNAEVKQMRLDLDERLRIEAEKIMKLESSLAEKELLVDQLEKDLGSLSNTSGDKLIIFQAEVKELEDKLALAKLEEQNAVLRVEEALNREWSEKVSQVNQTHDLELAQLKALISGHENQHEALSISLSELEKLILAFEEENKLLKDQNSELLSSTGATQQDILEKFEICQADCHAKDNSIAELRRIIADKESALDLLDKRLTSKGQEFEKLQLAIDRLNVSVDEKVAELDRLNIHIVNLELENSKLQAEIARLIEEKESLANNFEAKIAACLVSQNEKDDQHSTDLSVIESQFQEKMKEMQRKFVKKLKSVQGENEKTVNEVRRENEELLARNAALEKQLDSCKNVSDQLQESVDELTKELNRFREEHGEEIQKCQELVEAHQKELEELRKNQVSLLEESGNGEESEAELIVVKAQLEQAMSRESESCLKLEKAEESITELNQTISELNRNLEELRTKSKEELQLQAERMESECADKLTELKKKAEMRLKQIKSQVQLEKVSSVTEITQAHNNLEAELNTRNEELEWKSKDLQEKEAEINQLTAEIESMKCKFSDDILSIRKESTKKLEDELCSKDIIIDEFQSKCQQMTEETEQLRRTIQNLQAEGQSQAEKFSDLETKFKALKKQLVSAKHEIDRLKSEKDVDVRTTQLENDKEVARLASEYKEQLKDFEIDNNSRIKQLVKDFQLKLSEKEQEFQTTYMEALEKSQREEDMMMHQHKQELKSLRIDMREKEESYEETIQQLEVQLQAAELNLEEEVSKSQAEIERMKLFIERLEKQIAEHHEDLEAKNIETDGDNQQMVEEVIEPFHTEPLGASSSSSSSETSYNKMLEQQVIELTKQIEDLKIRYSLQVIRDQADANSEASTVQQVKSPLVSSDQQNEIQILELHNMDLQAQVIQQCGDIARLKIQEKALQQEVKMLHDQIGKGSENRSAADDVTSMAELPSSLSTEHQYLKNILLKFMTGIEQQTLARVICMVLKFSEEEIQLVMEHQNELFD